MIYCIGSRPKIVSLYWNVGLRRTYAQNRLYITFNIHPYIEI
jgi:hypothetical protein